MPYFERFNLRREPFSFTPDPDMFYHSRSRMHCLQELVVAIRLHRGVNAVVGGVGSGKTTLCRVLVRELAHFKGIDVYLILNANFAGRSEFLLHLGRLLGIEESALDCDPAELTGRIAANLAERHRVHNRIVCLLIDEGQVMTPECCDALEELSAIEITDGKLLQTVIFGQNEFLDLLSGRPALAQGMNRLHTLEPFSFRETRAMVEARLDAAAVADRPRPRFTWPALIYLHAKSGGFPRKIVRLCHRALIALPSDGRIIRLRHVKLSAQTLLVPAKPGGFPAKRAALAGAALLLAAWAAFAVFSARPSPRGLPGTPPPDAGVSAPPSAPSQLRAKVSEQIPPATPPGAAPEENTPGEAGPATARRPETNAGQTAAEADAKPAALPLQAPRTPPAAIDAATQFSGTGTPVAAPAEPQPQDAEATLTGASPQNGKTHAAEPEATAPAPQATAALAEPTGPTEPVEPAEPAARIAAATPAQPGGAAAPPPQDRAETGAQAAEPPALLGQVRLKIGWSFAKRQEDVYGRRDKAVFAAMAKANPGLVSIFDAGPGALVNFPAVAAPAPPQGAVLLRLMRADNLAQALDFIVDRSSPLTPLKLFATYSPARGTSLDVILARTFPSPDEAEQAKAALPPDLAAQAAPLTGFSRDTVFYSLLPPQAAPTGARGAARRTAQPEPAAQAGTNAPLTPTRPQPRPQPAKPPAPSPDRTPAPYVPN
jgi:general secretion pathway protein A